jgi:5-formyltetrahydrofolate cyclo-ligase
MSPEQLREKFKTQRDALSSVERAFWSRLIWDKLRRCEAFQAVEQLLFYVSHQSEVETRFMLALARQEGKRVCVPRSQPETKHLIFYEFTAHENLRPGPYGILEPQDNPDMMADLEVPSLILVPGLVFDKSGARLGWGKGYYDRFLGGEGKGIPSIGLAFDMQVTAALPQSPHDVRLNRIVTESRTIACKNN